MRAHEFINNYDQLDEDWKKNVAALGAATALTFGGLGVKGYLDQANAPIENPKQTQVHSASKIKHSFKTLKNTLLHVAKQMGMEGHELAQFMAQAAHETMNFHSLAELGNDNYFLKYDIEHNPRKAKILGNVNPGDGELYKGRGYLQITGRDNYRKCGLAIGHPLEEHPELLEDPRIAAKASVWYWSSRVKPKVTNFSNTKSVTKPINSGLAGLKDREAKFAEYNREFNNIKKPDPRHNKASKNNTKHKKLPHR